MEAQLRDPNLSASRVAASLDISRATLYRMFKAAGGVEGYIVGRRLDHCLKILMRSPRDPRQIKNLATANGFKNEVVFSRAFLQRYRTSPRTVIAFLQHSDAASGESLLAPLTAWLGQAASLYRLRTQAAL